MPNILITGSSGFLGSCIVDLALAEGYSVTGVDKNFPKIPPIGKFKFIQSDINNLGFLSIPKANIIIHTASSLPYGNSKKEFIDNNVHAAYAIAKLAKQTDAFLVEIVSSSVYGKPKETPVTRETPLAPLDDYAKSKLLAENKISEILDKKRYAVIRPRTILGPGRTGIFDIFFGLVRSGFPLPLPNSGKQIIQFAHVKDLARLSLHLGKNEISGIWPAASPEPKELRAYLFELSAKYLIPIKYLPVNSKLFTGVGTLASRSKLTKFTPWHFGAFPHHNFVDSDWIPEDFVYEFTCQESFNDTYESGKPSRRIIPRSTRIGWKV